MDAANHLINTFSKLIEAAGKLLAKVMSTFITCTELYMYHVLTWFLFIFCPFILLYSFFPFFFSVEI